MRRHFLFLTAVLCAGGTASTAAAQTPSSTEPAATPPAAPTTTPSPTPGTTDPTPPGQRGALKEEPERRPTLRFGFGYGINFRKKGGTGSSFDFDVNLGARLGLTTRVALWPEFGYSSNTDPISGGKFFAGGIGPIFGTPMIAVGWSPRVLIGDQAGTFGVGTRNSIVGSFVYNVVSAEIGHQWIHAGTANRHELRAVVAVDAVPIVAYFFFTNLMSSISRR